MVSKSTDWLRKSKSADREQIFAATTEARRYIAALLEELDETQLSVPSLCEGWTIRTVLGHLVSTLTDPTHLFLSMALRRGGLSHAIDELARRRAQRPVADLISSLGRLANRRVSPPGAGPLDPLADVLVHTGDIQLPLGMAFEPDRESAAMAVTFLTGPWRSAFVSRRLVRGLSLRSTDLDRSWGSGPEVVGPAGALMMAACGRKATLQALDGPGLPLLRARLTERF